MSSFRLLSRISGWTLSIRAPVQIQKARVGGLKSVSLFGKASSRSLTSSSSSKGNNGNNGTVSSFVSWLESLDIDEMPENLQQKLKTEIVGRYQSQQQAGWNFDSAEEFWNMFSSKFGGENGLIQDKNSSLIALTGSNHTFVEREDAIKAILDYFKDPNKTDQNRIDALATLGSTGAGKSRLMLEGAKKMMEKEGNLSLAVTYNGDTKILYKPLCTEIIGFDQDIMVGFCWRLLYSFCCGYDFDKYNETVMKESNYSKIKISDTIKLIRNYPYFDHDIDIKDIFIFVDELLKCDYKLADSEINVSVDELSSINWNYKQIQAQTCKYIDKLVSNETGWNENRVLIMFSTLSAVEMMKGATDIIYSDRNVIFISLYGLSSNGCLNLIVEYNNNTLKHLKIVNGSINKYTGNDDPDQQIKNQESFEYLQYIFAITNGNPKLIVRLAHNLNDAETKFDSMPMKKYYSDIIKSLRSSLKGTSLSLEVVLKAISVSEDYYCRSEELQDNEIWNEIPELRIYSKQGLVTLESGYLIFPSIYLETLALSIRIESNPATNGFKLLLRNMTTTFESKGCLLFEDIISANIQLIVMLKQYATNNTKIYLKDLLRGSQPILSNDITPMMYQKCELDFPFFQQFQKNNKFPFFPSNCYSEDDLLKHNGCIYIGGDYSDLYTYAIDSAQLIKIKWDQTFESEWLLTQQKNRIGQNVGTKVVHLHQLSKSLFKEYDITPTQYLKGCGINKKFKGSADGLDHISKETYNSFIQLDKRNKYPSLTFYFFAGNAENFDRSWLPPRSILLDKKCLDSFILPQWRRLYDVATQYKKKNR